MGEKPLEFRSAEQQQRDRVLVLLERAAQLAREQRAAGLVVVLLTDGDQGAIPIMTGANPFAMVGALEATKRDILDAIGDAELEAPQEDPEGEGPGGT